jgi:hypothetical protein
MTQPELSFFVKNNLINGIASQSFVNSQFKAMERKKTIAQINRLAAFLLAIHIFNFSIDSRDAQPDNIAEDLSYNDIESFHEFLLEDIFGLNDAIAEHDEHDSSDGSSCELKKIFSNPSLAKERETKHCYIRDLTFLIDQHLGTVTSFIEIDAPPPQA